jgi:hypothetical protein
MTVDCYQDKIKSVLGFCPTLFFVEAIIRDFPVFILIIF